MTSFYFFADAKSRARRLDTLGLFHRQPSRAGTPRRARSKDSPSAGPSRYTLVRGAVRKSTALEATDSAA